MSQFLILFLWLTNPGICKRWLPFLRPHPSVHATCSSPLPIIPHPVKSGPIASFSPSSVMWSGWSMTAIFPAPHLPSIMHPIATARASQLKTASLLFPLDCLFSSHILAGRAQQLMPVYMRLPVNRAFPYPWVSIILRMLDIRCVKNFLLHIAASATIL